MLSTLAMIAYPILLKSLGYSDTQSGFLIGSTSHDVAQVVGAGYSVSDDAGLLATLTEVLRVVTLPMLVLVIHVLFRDGKSGRSSFPWLLILFAALAVLRSVVDIPESIISVVSQVARWVMICAIAAIGLRTDLGAVLRVHPSLFLILLAETIFLLVISMVFTNLYIV